MKVNKKYMEIRYHECVCEVCNTTIKEENIIIFPCRHIFDDNCVLEMLRKYNYNITNLSDKIEKILIIKGEISALEKKKEIIETNKIEIENKGFFGGFLAGKASTPKKDEFKSLSKEEIIKLERFKKQYFDLLSEDCVLCGYLIVQNIRFKFDIDDYDKSSWMIF